MVGVGLGEDQAMQGQVPAAEFVDAESQVVDRAEGGAADQQDGQAEELGEVGAGQVGGVGDQQTAGGLDQQGVAGGGQLRGARPDVGCGDRDPRQLGGGLGCGRQP